MRNKGIDFPHPVLNEYTSDYLESAFSIEVLSQSDNGADLVIEIDCTLKSDGLLALLNSDKARAILRIMCHRTSYRRSVSIKVNDKTLITIPKSRIVDKFSMQAMIVANEELTNFSLAEFNPDLFANTVFSLRKGDVLADEPGIWVRLDTLVEPNVGGIVQVKCGEPNSPIKANFPQETDESLETSGYIYITLPEELYKTYHKLSHKKYLKTGVERFLQASVVLPALVEGVSRLRFEESTEDSGTQYRHTIWGESIYAGLAKRGITSLDGEPKSDYELANLLLGDVISDSISNLMTKASDWSKAQWEDPNL